MMQFIKIYRTTLVAICSILLMVLVFNVGLQVVSRWSTIKVPMWTEELGGFLIKWIVAFACGLQFLDKDPIGIDFFLHKMKPVPRAVMLGFNVVIACSFAIVLSYASINLIQRGARMRTPIMDLQYTYIYASIFVTGTLTLVSVLLRQYINSTAKRSARAQEDRK